MAKKRVNAVDPETGKNRIGILEDGEIKFSDKRVEQAEDVKHTETKKKKTFCAFLRRRKQNN